MTDHGRRLLAGLVALSLVTGCAAQNTAPELRPGQLLTARSLLTTAALPSGETQLITYVSEDADGDPIVVSGTVTLPSAPPPEGGWPVISWAHGTTGYADTCAPSADTADGLVHDYVRVVQPMLDSWVSRGYAVVQTDYQGLGTPGGHPYVEGLSEAHTVIDIVTAARELDSDVGTDWVAVGHSQGGQAVLFTAQEAEQRDGDLTLKGVVSIAPGGVGLNQAVDLIREGRPEVQSAQRFLPLLVLGGAVIDPSIDPDEVFSDQARPLLSTARTECVAQVRALPPVPPGQVFAPSADLTPLRAYLDQQDPMRLTPRVPVMMVQGTEDAEVDPAGVDELVKTLCSRDVAVDYRVYNGLDHRGVIDPAVPDMRGFVDAVTSGEPVDTCRR